MFFRHVLPILCIFVNVSIVTSDNYKITLTNKAYIQFLKHDAVASALREFTFCTWIRLFDLDNDQTVFAYDVDGVNVARLWIEAGAKRLSVSMNGTRSSTAIDWIKDVWQHFCMSYQSYHGALAIYVNGELTSCEAYADLHGYALPSCGNFVVGYGLDEIGVPSYMQGEIFGFYMIFSSTLGKAMLNQSHVYATNVRENSDEKSAAYVKMHKKMYDLKSTAFNVNPNPVLVSELEKDIRFIKPYNAADINEELSAQSPLKPKGFANSFYKNNKINLSESNDYVATPKTHIHNLFNEMNQGNIIKGQSNIVKKMKSDSDESLRVSLSITAPSLFKINDSNFINTYETMETKPSIRYKDLKLNHLFYLNDTNNLNVSEIEKPPAVSKDKPVYGNWVGINFANQVLQHLKHTNLMNQMHRVPPTIPLTKMSHSYPYPSRITKKIHSPYQSKHRDIIRQHKIGKRDVHNPNINVHIIKDNMREMILQFHSQTMPKKVEVVNRGEIKNLHEVFNFSKNLMEIYSLNPKRHLIYTKYENNKNDSSISADDRIINSQPAQNLSKLIEHTNEYKETEGDIGIRPDVNPYISLLQNYNYEYIGGKEINNGSQGTDKGVKSKREFSRTSKGIENTEKLFSNNVFQEHVLESTPNHQSITKNNFERKVKIGNALNENEFIGTDGEEINHSFVEGNLKIPDIVRYSSFLDGNFDVDVPFSVRPKFCAKADLKTNEKNIAITFIKKSYLKCAMKSAYSENEFNLVIDWSKTPIRLFGNAQINKVDILCNTMEQLLG